MHGILAVCGVLATGRVWYSRCRPCVVFPLQAVCGITSAGHVCYSRYMTCVVFALHDMCDILAAGRVSYSHYWPCVVFPLQAVCLVFPLQAVCHSLPAGPLLCSRHRCYTGAVGSTGRASSTSRRSRTPRPSSATSWRWWWRWSASVCPVSASTRNPTSTPVETNSRDTSPPVREAPAWPLPRTGKVSGSGFVFDHFLWLESTNQQKIN